MSHVTAKRDENCSSQCNYSDVDPSLRRKAVYKADFSGPWNDPIQKTKRNNVLRAYFDGVSIHSSHKAFTDG
jgi:hypothetical protein